MPKRIAIAPHLSVEELQARFREAKTTTQTHHYQIIWLLACGKTTAEVMAVTGYSRGWIYELVRGYNHLGPESLGDQRCKNTDCDPLLNDVEQAQLWQALQQPPPDGGLWNGRKVADWMSELKGEKVCRQRGWEYLKSMKFRLRVPRPSHQESDLLEQEEWKKKSTPSSQENPEKIPFKRRRSLVNGRTPSGIKTDFETRVGGRV
jgi:transposase